MKILFLGTGEAWGKTANVSMLIDDKILLECGPHTVLQFMKMGGNIKRIRMIYLSHLHADHAFGLPAFLLVSTEEGREEDLLVVGPKGISRYLEEILRFSYNKKLTDLSFDVRLKEMSDTLSFSENGYNFSFQKIPHSFPCYSISITSKNKKLTYTSDGSPTDETAKLAMNSDLLISEAYGREFEKHSSIVKASQLAKKSKSKVLALVHIFRKVDVDKELEEATKIFSPIIIPNEFDTIWI